MLPPKATDMLLAGYGFTPLTSSTTSDTPLFSPVLDTKLTHGLLPISILQSFDKLNSFQFCVLRSITVHHQHINQRIHKHCLPLLDMQDNYLEFFENLQL